MKIRLEMDESVSEEEIIIRCKELTDEVVTLQKRIAEIGKTQMQLHVTKGDSAYFLELDEILFLESSGATVAVHTANHMYETKQRLYELEEILPHQEEHHRCQRGGVYRIGEKDVCIKKLF